MNPVSWILILQIVIVLFVLGLFISWIFKIISDFKTDAVQNTIAFMNAQAENELKLLKPEPTIVDFHPDQNEYALTLEQNLVEAFPMPKGIIVEDFRPTEEELTAEQYEAEGYPTTPVWDELISQPTRVATFDPLVVTTAFDEMMGYCADDVTGGNDSALSLPRTDEERVVFDIGTFTPESAKPDTEEQHLDLEAVVKEPLFFVEDKDRSIIDVPQEILDQVDQIRSLQDTVPISVHPSADSTTPTPEHSDVAENKRYASWKTNTTFASDEYYD